VKENRNIGKVILDVPAGGWRTEAPIDCLPLRARPAHPGRHRGFTLPRFCRYAGFRHPI